MRAQLFILLTICALKCFAKKGCEETLKHLANIQSTFVICAIEHSVPATACLSCPGQYRNMTLHYKTLIENCSNIYISQNRLDMVYNMELYLEAIWNKGFCGDCFNEQDTISNDTSKFSDMNTDFEDCLVKYPKAPCPNCIDKYIDLNDFFKEMEKVKKGNVCFDIQDKMNRTRVKWSKELRCCHRDFNLNPFLVGSGIFCAIPLIFYLGMYGYTKRLERNHEAIDSTYGIPRQQNSPSTSTTTYGAMATREAPLNADRLNKSARGNIQEDTDTLPSTSSQVNSAH